MIKKYKLYGRIDQPLLKWNYSLVVKDQYHIGSLKLQKGINLVIPSSLGGPLYFYPVTFLIMAIMCFAYGIYLRYEIGDYDQLMKSYEQQTK